MKMVQQANRNARNNAKRLAATIKRDGKRVGQIVKALQRASVNVSDVSVDDSCYNISVLGSRADLDVMFGVLRRAGLTPSRRPQEKETYYGTFWHFEDTAPVWVAFSSTTCKRVQVRTEIQEVPVYEVVCEE